MCRRRAPDRVDWVAIIANCGDGCGWAGPATVDPLNQSVENPGKN
jgi:hypothetical protein